MLLKVLWYKDTMKLMESSHLHILNVGDTYKLTILGRWNSISNKVIKDI